MLPINIDSEQYAGSQEGVAGLELQLLRDEGREAVADTDQDLLRLVALCDVVGVAGHLVDEFAVDFTAFHLVNANDIGVLDFDKLYDFFHFGPGGIAPGLAKVLDIPGSKGEEFCHLK